MKTTTGFFFLLFMIPCLFFGQQQKKQVLFTVNEKPVYTANFKHMYLKNSALIDNESQMDIDRFLDRYIDYSLKIAAAKDAGLAEDPSFKKEYQKYHDQLVQNTLAQTEVSEALIQEAYERMQTAVNASHILIKLPKNASPADTLKAYEKTLEIRKKIVQGKSFEAMAKKYSDDPSVQMNGGELGWFSVLKMVYPFETGAYTTEVGKISMPVRTNFGYHLIKVNDKRPAKGKVTVAHIMLVKRENDSLNKPKERIYEIYQQLQKGASFEKLAKKFSNDKKSAFKGGKLAPFSLGEMNAPKFEKVAFSLSEPTAISQPFETRFGWHIIKLLQKNPIGSLEEVREQLKARIKKDSRSHLIVTELIEQLRKEYHIKKNKKALTYFQKHVDEQILRGNWKMEAAEIPSKTLIEIQGDKKTYLDFASYLSIKQKTGFGIKNKNQLIEKWLKEFTDNFVLEHHKANLEETNPEFAALATEYYNGLLIFDIMEQKIWNVAKTDSLGLQKYFKDHRKKYDKKELEAIRGTVVSDYQNQLETAWVKELHKTYKVDIHERNVKKLKANFE